MQKQTFTWKSSRSSKPLPIESLNTEHIYNILRTLVKQQLPRWRAMNERGLERASNGPMGLAEENPLWDALMEVLEQRGLDWLQLNDELRQFSADMTEEAVEQLELA